MKTKKDTRLSLNKETIAHLDLAMMAQVVGGSGSITDPDETIEDCTPKKPSNPCQTR